MGLTVNERDTWTIWVSSGDDAKVPLEKFDTTDLEALLHNLGSKLVNAVAVRVHEDVVNDTTLVRRGTMLAEVLDAPIAELTMSDQIDVGNDFLDGRTLAIAVRRRERQTGEAPSCLPFPPQRNSRRYSGRRDYRFRLGQLHATFHGVPR